MVGDQSGCGSLLDCTGTAGDFLNCVRAVKVTSFQEQQVLLSLPLPFRFPSPSTFHFHFHFPFRFRFLFFWRGSRLRPALAQWRSR